MKNMVSSMDSRTFFKTGVNFLSIRMARIIFVLFLVMHIFRDTQQLFFDMLTRELYLKREESIVLIGFVLFLYLRDRPQSFKTTNT